MGVVAASTARWPGVSLKRELTAALRLGNHDLALRLADLITPPVKVVRPVPRGNRLEPISGELGEPASSSAA